MSWAWMPGCDSTAGAGIIWWQFSLKCTTVDAGALVGAIDGASYLGLSLLFGFPCRMAPSGHLELTIHQLLLQKRLWANKLYSLYGLALESSHFTSTTVYWLQGLEGRGIRLPLERVVARFYRSMLNRCCWTDVVVFSLEKYICHSRSTGVPYKLNLFWAKLLLLPPPNDLLFSTSLLLSMLQ